MSILVSKTWHISCSMNSVLTTGLTSLGSARQLCKQNHGVPLTLALSPTVRMQMLQECALDLVV